MFYILRCTIQLGPWEWISPDTQQVWGTKVWLGNVLAESMDERVLLIKWQLGGFAEVAFSTWVLCTDVAKE